MIGGTETRYEGRDGDEFYSSVHWDGTALGFETVEHEDKSQIPQKAVSALSVDHNTLQVDRRCNKVRENYAFVDHLRSRTAGGHTPSNYDLIPCDKFHPAWRGISS